MWTSALARPIITTPLPRCSHASMLSCCPRRLPCAPRGSPRTGTPARGTRAAARSSRYARRGYTSGMLRSTRGLGAGLIDARHEFLLLTREHRRITGIVGPDPVGSQLTQRIEVVVHPSLPVASSSSRNRSLARFRRERTVPTGTPSAVGDLVVAQLLPHEQQRARRALLREAPSPPRRRVATGRRRRWRRRRDLRRRPPRASAGRPAAPTRGSGALRSGGAWPRGSSRCRTATAGRSSRSRS